jgi:uncharacterized damage-inducible protein DinB
VDEQLVETWSIHNRINVYMVEAISEEGLVAAVNPKSRNVYALFAHMHNVRLMWLKAAAPNLLEGQEKLDTKLPVAKAQLIVALNASGQAVETLLREAVVNGGKVKGFKPHAAAFVGYLISHESHHRGQAEWALRFSGHALPDNISYGLWEWGSR